MRARSREVSCQAEQKGLYALDREGLAHGIKAVIRAGEDFSQPINCIN